ncbi:MAG: hypothetical protein MR209_05265 [Veillonellaceae bacterium]|nr:hypothetical protein [Veillonellaceae bacterium]
MKKTWYRYPAYFFLAGLIISLLGGCTEERLSTLRPPVVTEDIRLEREVRWEPLRTAEATPLITGRVIGTPKAPGAFVQAGEVLAQIDTTPYLEQLERARVTATPAAPPYNPAAAEADELLAQGIITAKERDRIYARESVGQPAPAVTDTAATENYETALAGAHILAPIAGIVQASAVGEDGVLVAGSPAFLIAAVRPVGAEFTLPAAAVTAAGTAVVHADYAGRDYVGSGRILASRDGLIPFRVEFANEDDSLRLHEPAQLSWRGGGTMRVLHVPPSAVRDNAIYTVAENGLVERVPVQIAYRTSEYVAVLAAGEESVRIVREPPADLAGGMVVRYADG